MIVTFKISAPHLKHLKFKPEMTRFVNLILDGVNILYLNNLQLTFQVYNFKLF